MPELRGLKDNYMAVAFHVSFWIAQSLRSGHELESSFVENILYFLWNVHRDSSFILPVICEMLQ